MINFSPPDQEEYWQISEHKEVLEFEEGLSHSTYLVVCEDRKYVVRDFHLNKSVADSLKELWMMQLAAELGISPKIEHIDLKKGYVIIDYIEGGHPNLSSEDLSQAVKQLKKMHQQLSYEPFSSIYHCYEQIELDDPTSIDDAIRIIKEIEAAIRQYPATFCHLDFHTKNIIEGDDGVTWIIDWETAGLSHPYYDIAKLTHNLSFEEALDLLSEYLGEEPSKCQEGQLYLMRCVVYMSIATNRYLREQNDTAEHALSDFLEKTSSHTFKEYLQVVKSLR